MKGTLLPVTASWVEFHLEAAAVTVDEETSTLMRTTPCYLVAIFSHSYSTSIFNCTEYRSTEPGNVVLPDRQG